MPQPKTKPWKSHGECLPRPWRNTALCMRLRGVFRFIFESASRNAKWYPGEFVGDRGTSRGRVACVHRRQAGICGGGFVSAAIPRVGSMRPFLPGAKVHVRYRYLRRTVRDHPPGTRRSPWTVSDTDAEEKRCGTGRRSCALGVPAGK